MSRASCPSPDRTVSRVDAGRPQGGPRAGRAEAAQAPLVIAVVVAEDDVGRRPPRQDPRLLGHPCRAVGRAERVEHEHPLAAGDDAAVAEGGERRAVVGIRGGDHGPDAVADGLDSRPHLAGDRVRLRPRGPAPAGRQPGRGDEKTTKDIASCHLSVPPGNKTSSRTRGGRPRAPSGRARPAVPGAPGPDDYGAAKRAIRSRPPIPPTQISSPTCRATVPSRNRAFDG